MIDFDITAFTPVSALIGGGLIGLAAAVLILGSGHILGMSGIAQKGLGTLPKLSWQLRYARHGSCHGVTRSWWAFRL